jgi:hypothetical protein
MGFANQITTGEFSREGSVGKLCDDNRTRLIVEQILRGSTTHVVSKCVPPFQVGKLQ